MVHVWRRELDIHLHEMIEREGKRGGCAPLGGKDRTVVKITSE
jgi:hypothetical protein